jgi:hypothetical protein
VNGHRQLLLFSSDEAGSIPSGDPGDGGASSNIPAALLAATREIRGKACESGQPTGGKDDFIIVPCIVVAVVGIVNPDCGMFGASGNDDGRSNRDSH